MENRELTNSEVEKIIKHFLGDEYLQVVDVFVGYADILGSNYLTEIYNDHNLLISIYVYTVAFSDDDLTPEEVVGYIRCEMEHVMPHAKVRKHMMNNHIVNLNFEWY